MFITYIKNDQLNINRYSKSLILVNGLKSKILIKKFHAFN